MYKKHLKPYQAVTNQTSRGQGILKEQNAFKEYNAFKRDVMEKIIAKSYIRFYDFIDMRSVRFSIGWYTTSVRWIYKHNNKRIVDYLQLGQSESSSSLELSQYGRFLWKMQHLFDFFLFICSLLITDLCHVTFFGRLRSFKKSICVVCVCVCDIYIK